MHLAYIGNADCMGNPKHGKVGYILLLKQIKLNQAEFTVG